MKKNTQRYLSKQISKELSDRMIFLGGPRQAGKTTLARDIVGQNGPYLNWDSLEDREIILKRKYDLTKEYLLFDEIHKYKLWRTLVKGIFDKYKDVIKILVTGSGRLDYFRKGGDSLAGRYFYYRLHPFSFSEIAPLFPQDGLERLLKFSGFPEPFLKGDELFYKKWSREMTAKIITGDLRDLEMVKEISLVELLAEILPDRVGSLLSVKSLSEDLSVSPNSVSRWIEILERLYFCYRISPFGSERLRSVKKSPKLYLYDWAKIPENGPRFENLVASHLLKYCHYHEDVFGEKMDLRYLKDVDRDEADFIVIKNKKPIFVVECKTGERSIAKSLHFYKEKYKIPRAYQVHLGLKMYGHAEKDVLVLPFSKFCELEKLP